MIKCLLGHFHHVGVVLNDLVNLLGVDRYDGHGLLDEDEDELEDKDALPVCQLNDLVVSQESHLGVGEVLVSATPLDFVDASKD